MRQLDVYDEGILERAVSPFDWILGLTTQVDDHLIETYKAHPCPLKKAIDHRAALTSYIIENVPMASQHDSLD
jgi:hypothetical protein